MLVPPIAAEFPAHKCGTQPLKCVVGDSKSLVSVSAIQLRFAPRFEGGLRS